MKIKTDTDTIDGLGIGMWAVVTVWYGRDQIVFRGSLFDCLDWYHGLHSGRLPA